MFPKMEVILSAVMIELANRSICFLINKCSKLMALYKEDMVHNLRRLLLRAGAIVDEAEGRCITNPALLHQLNMMRKELYRGNYMWDTFLCQDPEGDEARGNEAGHPFTLSRFNPAKRLRICSGNSKSRKELMRVLGSLETTLQDAAEFIMLSGRYHQITRQPYNMYLLLNNCMFGRQKEMEHILNFLLQSESPSDGHLVVLPIIGPRKVGKSTLVEHVSIDERVRHYFSQIMFLSGDDLRGELMVTLADSRTIKYDNKDLIRGRVLIIIELDSDLNEGLWQRFLSSSSNLAPGSKLIITGRSEKIISFGTTQPLRLQFFTPEVFWYFFKVRMFGCMDVTEHPKLASVAMDMAKDLNGCFMCFNIISEILKSNIDAHFWSLTLAICRHFKQKNPLVCDPPNKADPWALARPVLIPTTNKISAGNILIIDMYQTASAQSGAHFLEASTSTPSDSTAPKMTVKDLMLGHAKPHGKFAAFAWKSHIRPHYNCVFKCELRMPRRVASRKNRN